MEQAGRHTPHVHHDSRLHSEWRAICEQNPTYYEKLQRVRELRGELKQQHDSLRHYSTAFGSSDSGRGKKGAAPDTSVDPRLIAMKESVVELQERFREADDELADIAEALLAKPKVRAYEASSSDHHRGC